jgi:hypothetical protein
VASIRYRSFDEIGSHVRSLSCGSRRLRNCGLHRWRCTHWTRHDSQVQGFLSERGTLHCKPGRVKVGSRCQCRVDSRCQYNRNSHQFVDPIVSWRSQGLQRAKSL